MTSTTMIDAAADDFLGRTLLNDCQQDFPLCAMPFAELAGRLGVGERDLLDSLTRLRREGRILRVGAVFAPKRIGASTLAAMTVPPERLAAVVESIGRFPEVNHVVVREHRVNLWFVVTAGGEGRLESALAAIEAATGLELLRLPLLGELRKTSVPSEDASLVPRASGMQAALDEIGRRLVMALQEGLPLLVRPFAVLASRVGCEEREVIERIRAWQLSGDIKRFGVVVRSPAGREAAQALWLLDVPEAELDEVAQCLAEAPALALCYRRPRLGASWPYNVYCTVVGESRAAVEDALAALRARLAAYPQAVLHALGHTPLPCSGTTHAA